jgi:hypothetical protein
MNLDLSDVNVSLDNHQVIHYTLRTMKNMTVDKIVVALGFFPNIEDDPYKVKDSWGFSADGVTCGIWDYKGSEQFGQYSTYGPDAVFKTLFGDDYENR